MNDLRFALRQLRKSPGFTAVAVVTLALGIGANAAIFSVVDAVLLRPLPYEDPGRLVVVWEDHGGAGVDRASVPGGVFADWKENASSFEALSLFSPTDANLTGAGDPERLVGARVSADFFDVLRVRPRAGRAFLPGEDRPGREKVVVLSDGLWRRRFGGDPAVVGSTTRLGAEDYTVVGVLPADFHFPLTFDFWAPLPFGAEDWHLSRVDQRFIVIGRLRPGVTPRQARADIGVVRRRLDALYPEWKKNSGATVVPLQEQLVGGARPALLVLLAAVAVVLLIACSNVANLLLVRGTGRRKEIAVRVALGAGRWRVARMLLVESLVLATIGGALALLLAQWGVGLLLRLAPELPRAVELGVDGRVLAFAASLTLATGVLFGLLPAADAARARVGDALKGSGRGLAGDARGRARGAAVVAQVAAALVLLAGAGLLLRSFRSLLSVPPGFNPAGALAADVTLPESKYPEPARRGVALQEMIDRVESLPGVEAAGLVSTVPMGGRGLANQFTVEGRADQPPLGHDTAYDFCTAGYFRAAAIPLLRGRVPAPTRSLDPAREVVVDETLARRHFPGEDPVGRRIGFWGETWEVVGVVGAVRHGGLENPLAPRLYAPQAFSPWGGTLVVRARGEPLALAEPLRRQILAVDPEQAVSNVRTLEQVVDASVARRRVLTQLVAVFGAAAVALAAVGLYGVIAYSVASRTREIGVRVALGAPPRQVLATVAGQGLRLTACGIGVGLVGAVASSRLLRPFLYGVAPSDVPTLAAVALVLCAAAALACVVPARRAARVDPMEALRHE